MKLNLLYVSCLQLLLLTQIGCGKKPDSGSSTGAPENREVQNLLGPEELTRDLKKSVREENTKRLSELFHANQTFDYNQHLDDGETLLTLSIKLHKVISRDYLLQIGVNPEIASQNEETLGFTPLMLAAANGHLSSLKALIEQKVNLNRINADGDTALNLAIKNRHEDNAITLIKAGAATEILNFETKDALTLATENDTNEVLEFLHGIYQAQMGNLTPAIFKSIINSGDAQSLRTLAATHRSLVLSYENQNPLVMLLSSSDENSAFTMAQILLQIGIKVDGPVTRETTPLIESVKLGKKLFTELFIISGDIALTDKNGKSALYHAIETNQFDMVELLVKNEAPLRYNRPVRFNACSLADRIERELLRANVAADKESNRRIQLRLGCRL